MFITRISIAGLTLVELLVALTLSSVIFSGVSIAFITSQKNQKIQYALDEIQENAAMAFYYLKKNIRGAGIFIKGDDTSIVIKKTSLGAQVRQLFSNVIILSKKPILHKHDEVIISDSGHSENLKIAAVIYENNLQKIILEKTPQFKYSKLAEIKRLDEINFVVQATKRLDQWGNRIYALYANKMNHRVEELVEGVSSIKFLYAIKIGNKVVTLHAVEIQDWQNVVGVEMHLQFASVAGFKLQKELHGFAAIYA